MSQDSTFIIVRDDRGLDPTALISEALKIGRSLDSDLLLNHPTVSRLHAGIKEIDGRFFLFHLSPSNSTTLNGRLVAPDETEALVTGDQARIGPFILQFDRQDEALTITVTMQVGLNIGEAEARDESFTAQTLTGLKLPPAKKVAHALDLFWSKRSREKAGRKSPLHPRRPPRLGKARFNWSPTRDLVRPWPFAVFLWSFLLLGVSSIAAAVWYTSAYAPRPISDSHNRATLNLAPPIAIQPNAGACISCHSIRTGMEQACTSCHTTEAFAGAVTKPHEQVGLECVTCHAEHKGKDFRPMDSALMACTKCHNDANTKTYNGKVVFTPHGGTLGYPVVNGQWEWKGLDAEELAERPNIAALRLKTDTERQWLSKQFHALHLRRVRATSTIAGVADYEGAAPVLSCSSCHHSFNPIDRVTPRQTCAECHTGPIEAAGQTTIPANAPNCLSCHVQHIADKRHWNPKMVVEPAKQAAGEK